jgi:hypothetical protein
MRTTRAFSKGILRRNLICIARGGSGISSDTCDRNGKERRIARSAPPALSLSRVQNSKNSLPCPLIPRTNTGMARQIRAHRRRSRSSFGKAWRRFGMHNHTEIAAAGIAGSPRMTTWLRHSEDIFHSAAPLKVPTILLGRENSGIKILKTWVGQ